MRSLEGQFYWAGDRRAVLVSAYVITTDEIARQIDAGAYHDGEWVERCVVDFANLYREALVNYEAGRRDRVPPVWLVSFDYSTSGHRLVLDDLWLGITGHVNRDIAFCLVSAGMDGDLGAKLADHREINGALAASVGPIRRRVAQLYAPGWEQMNGMTAGLAHALTVRTMVRRREQAWNFAVQMAHSPTAECRERCRRAVDEQAALRAWDNIVLQDRFPHFYGWLTAVEQRGMW